MGALLTYRDAVVEALLTELPSFKTVSGIGGALSAEMLKRYSTLTPAALIAILQARNTIRDNVGHMIGPVVSTIYVIDKDPRRDQVWAPALDLAEQVADVIELNQFGLDYVAAARVRDIDVLYNNAIDAVGLCLAAVTFTQEVQWGRDRNAEDEQAEFPGWTDPDVVAHGWGTSVEGRLYVGRGYTHVEVPLTFMRLIGARQVQPPTEYPAPEERVIVEEQIVTEE